MLNTAGLQHHWWLRPTAITLAILGLLLVVIVLFGINLAVIYLLIMGLAALWAAWCLWEAGDKRPGIQSHQSLGGTAESKPTLNGQFSQQTLYGGALISGGAARRVTIDYKDAKGKEFTRDLSIYAVVERDGAIKLDAYSEGQQSCRTYEAERIQRLENLETGDVITENITSYLRSL